jgi:hypothetical protein
MHNVKLITAVACAALGFGSTSAMAQQWIVNCASHLCLDATQIAPGGRVQVSTCSAKNPELRGQQWDANKPQSQNIQNRWIADNNQNGGCLDIFVNPPSNWPQTTECNSYLQAEKWNFTQSNQGKLISNVYTGECLEDVSLPTTSPPDTVGLVKAPCDGTKSTQKWKWVNVGDPNLACP